MCCAAKEIRDTVRDMSMTSTNAPVLTSARMAAGMTSRARRPESCISAA
jgi:hypothetical protein